MKALTTVLLFVVCSLATFAQEISAKQRLIQAYHALCQQPDDSTRQLAFFQAYPATFSELQTCFGYNRFREPDLDYVTYSQAYEQLHYVSDNQKIIHLFNILVGGYWQADGQNAHLDILRKLMRKDSELAFSIIAKDSIQRQILFWQCYWQNPCLNPWLEEDYNLYNKLKDYKTEKEVMKQAYDLFRGELPILEFD